MNITKSKYKFDINDYGKHYRPLTKEAEANPPVYILNDKGARYEGHLTEFKEWVFWDYYAYMGPGYDEEINDLLYTANPSYVYDRYKFELVKAEKLKNDELKVSISITNIFLDYCFKEKNIQGFKIIDEMVIRTQDNIYFEETNFFTFKPYWTTEFEFIIDLKQEREIIILYVEMGVKGRNLITKEFTLDLGRKSDYWINFSKNNTYCISNPISFAKGIIKYEMIELKRIAEQKYDYPEPIHDLFSLEYMGIDEQNSPKLVLPDIIKAKFEYDNTSNAIEIKHRNIKNKHIFFVTNKTYFDLKARKVNFGSGSIYKNEHEGLTLNWDKPSRGIIKMEFEIKAFDKYKFEILQDVSNSHPLIGREGKWKIIEKKQQP